MVTQREPSRSLRASEKPPAVLWGPVTPQEPQQLPWWTARTVEMALGGQHPHPLNPASEQQVTAPSVGPEGAGAAERPLKTGSQRARWRERGPNACLAPSSAPSARPPPAGAHPQEPLGGARSFPPSDALFPDQRVVQAVLTPSPGLWPHPFNEAPLPQHPPG